MKRNRRPRGSSSPLFLPFNFCVPFRLLCEMKAKSFSRKKEEMVHTEGYYRNRATNVERKKNAQVRISLGEGKEAKRGEREGEKKTSLCLFRLCSSSSLPASTTSASLPAPPPPLGKGRQNVEEHHEVDRDHGGPAGEHEAPRVIQRGGGASSCCCCAAEERGDES